MVTNTVEPMRLPVTRLTSLTFLERLIGDLNSRQGIMALDDDPNLEKALSGDESALAELLSTYRERLKQFARFRMNSQLRRRIDESDVVQEALIDVSRRLEEFDPQQGLSFYQWLRHLVKLKAAELYRYHVKTQARDARKEIRADQEDADGNLVDLADQLVDSMTSPTRQVRKLEMRERIRSALQSMDELDQEILFLRHFEQLSTQESADVIGISKAGAGSRYLRALKRLRSLIEQAGQQSDHSL